MLTREPLRQERVEGWQRRGAEPDSTREGSGTAHTQWLHPPRNSHAMRKSIRRDKQEQGRMLSAAGSDGGIAQRGTRRSTMPDQSSRFGRIHTQGGTESGAVRWLQSERIVATPSSWFPSLEEPHRSAWASRPPRARKNGSAPHSEGSRDTSWIQISRAVRSATAGRLDMPQSNNQAQAGCSARQAPSAR